MTLSETKQHVPNLNFETTLRDYFFPFIVFSLRFSLNVALALIVNLLRLLFIDKILGNTCTFLIAF